MTPRRIFAMGGGGFTMEPGNPLLDRYILSLAASPIPRVCFLPTASGDPDDHIARFYAAFGDELCEPSHLSLFRLGRQPVALADALCGADIVYVGGGSMLNMLAVWRTHGLDRVLAEAWRRGVVLCGLSAGSMCWFEGGVTKSVGRPETVEGLGLLPGSNSVHYDGEPERRPVYLQAVAAGDLPDGYAVDDGAGLLWEERRLVRAVSSRPSARVLHVERRGDEAVETPVEVSWLGASSGADGAPRVTPADVAELRHTRAAGRAARESSWGRLGATRG